LVTSGDPTSGASGTGALGTLMELISHFCNGNDEISTECHSTSATHHLLSHQEMQMLMVTATLNTQSHQGTMHSILKI
jgi:hypothetical protein